VIGSISSSADYFRVEEFEGRRKRESYPSATLLASWNLVGLLVRPEYYENDEDAKQELSGKAELIIAKQRNGPTGEVPLTF
jgi:replicative DNA helicase